MWAPLLLASSLYTAPCEADDPLEFSLVGVDVQSVGLQQTELELVAEVTRTRWPPIRLRSLEHQVSISGETVAEGEASYERTKLRKGEPQQIRIPVSFRTLQAAGALGRGLLGGARIDIELQGTMRGCVLLIPFQAPIEESLADVDLGL